MLWEEQEVYLPIKAKNGATTVMRKPSDIEYVTDISGEDKDNGEE